MDLSSVSPQRTKEQGLASISHLTKLAILNCDCSFHNYPVIAISNTLEKLPVKEAMTPKKPARKYCRVKTSAEPWHPKMEFRERSQKRCTTVIQPQCGLIEIHGSKSVQEAGLSPPTCFIDTLHPSGGASLWLTKETKRSCRKKLRLGR